jgi:hypothetical protein
MKRILVAILLLVYFTVSTGFVINLHYCMDKMASVELGGSESEECGKCGMPTKEKDSCCRDEVKVVKLYQDQLTAHFIDFQIAAIATLVVPSEFLISPFKNTSLFTSHKAHAPPLISEQDTYLRNGVFRI